MRLRTFFRGKTTDREMIEEMELHLERATERLIARGLSPDEARLAARREFGNVAVLQEEGRDARGARWIESIGGDIRFALRYFTRKPLTTATIVLVLSIGIGVHAAVFSLFQSVMTRPAPGVPHDDALVAIRGKAKLGANRKWRGREISYPEFRDLAGQRDVFSSVAGWALHDVTLDAGEDQGNAAKVQFVTSGFFATIGVRPIIGSGLPLYDEAATSEPQLVAVIGHTLWNAAFASSPDILGKTIRVNDVPVRIVGVAPPRFNGAVATSGTRMLWMPLPARPVIARTSASAFASRDSALLTTVARLRSGATIDAANAAVRVIDARSAEQESLADGVAHDADVVPLRGEIGLYADKENAIMTAVYELLAFLILLITCANVSALVVGAAVTRRPEIAIRLSLGASRMRLIRQLLTESSLLALAGGALGLLIYWWIAKLLVMRLPAIDLVPDLATVAFTMCFALGTGILFGLSPALHATRRGTADVLKDSTAGATGRSRLQRTFVVAQIALTQPLLVGLGVTIAILFQDSRARPNSEVATQTISIVFDLYGPVRIDPGSKGPSVSDMQKAQSARVDAALQRIAALPGVVGTIPQAGAGTDGFTVVPEDRGALPQSSRPVELRVEGTSPGYFALLGIPIVHGRELVASDTAARDVPIVIGSDLADDLWGSEGAIGKRFESEVGANGTGQRYVVVGVYDSRRGIASGTQPRVYTPMTTTFISAYLIRTDGPAAPLMATVRSIINAEAPRVPLVRLETLAERDQAERAEALSASGAAGGGGLLALLLASIGLYGVVALALGQRRREIGIRISMGARPRQVVRMLFWSGLRLSVTGLLLGLPLSIIAMNVATAELGLPDINVPAVGAAIALVVIAVASIATWLPSRHAATVDPMIALRTD